MVVAPSTFRPPSNSVWPVTVAVPVIVAEANVDAPASNVPLTSALPLMSALPSAVKPSMVVAPSTFRPPSNSVWPVTVRAWSSAISAPARVTSVAVIIMMASLPFSSSTSNLINSSSVALAAL